MLPECSLFYRVKGHFGSHSCVRSNSCISWQIFFFFKFCMGLYQVLKSTRLVFGDAAPSVPSFIGLKVIFGWSLAWGLQATFLDFLSFKCCNEVHRGQIYTPIVFGDAVLSLVSFVGSKVTFWLLSCVRSASHISRVILFFRFCMFFGFLWCCPQFSTFCRVRRTKSFTILWNDPSI